MYGAVFAKAFTIHKALHERFALHTLSAYLSQFTSIKER